MNFVILFTLAIIVSCSPQPTLEQLEVEASTTGNWTAVERREEVMKKSLESRGPGCPKGLNKYCVEEQSGIQCYCLPLTFIRE